MIYVVGPFFLLAFFPIIFIEARFYHKLAGLPLERAGYGAILANLLSTVVGIPVTWVVLVFLMIITGGGEDGYPRWLATMLQAPWLGPNGNKLELMIPSAAIILHLPFFLMSLGVEYVFLRRYFKQADQRQVWRACWMGNLATYVCLTGFWLIVLLYRTLNTSAAS